MTQTEEARYQAVRGRDARFDGEFFFAVRTTGVYCRPSCPSRPPRRENVVFYPSAAAAQAGGFRACRRCRPDAVPGSAAWQARADASARAMRLIGDGAVDRDGVAGLAARLGYSPRQLQRLLVAEVGAGPLALARAQRAHSARILLQTTTLPVTDVAFAAGFASVRQFNDTVRAVYAATPTELRASGRNPVRASSSGIPLRLAYRGPYAARPVFDFLAARAIPGVEEMEGEPGARRYRRTLALPGGPGLVAVREPSGERGWLECTVTLADLRDLAAATQRVRRLFDLDADPYAVAETLSGDPVLGPLVEAVPGVRAPGAADPEELAFRAVLGQQVTVAAARTLGGRVVSALGTPLPEPSGTLTHLFPEAAALAESPLTGLGMPASRHAALHALATALSSGEIPLDPGADRDEAEKALLSVRGIGAWTAAYIRMRALGDPDVLPPGDVVLRRALAAAGAPDPVAWAPWRSYATQLLWRAPAPSRERNGS
ncbi:helix-turn-helix domain-containing protein [Actinocorallia sp. API 0066]|uniref:DNA-3-methyladenine glycosylase 2 family protein n=1 Tax=Actinocorallia sp. API 0066 TaxID=2896846 RepID=UPI001E5A2829|nr:DNA-3-methyladenine glycosylase 2 family protein [Actinocorallia sp. API 0066]MCD0452759.1 helix-turn-helix domain-containing protein [Actinocorallia sp. API 0066]